ncbi:MAG: DUF2158 domain-containing protein [Verrucomicrobiota bacterium]
MNFELGQLVRLTAGGPIMVVISASFLNPLLRKPQVETQWFDKAGQVHTGKFFEFALENARAPETDDLD